MAFTFGFFNAQQVNGDYDRKYGADELAEYFSYLIGNGISGDVSNCFKVSAGSGMQVYIEPGYGWINGYWCKSNARVTKSLSVAPSIGNRVDSVVLRYIRADRKIDIDVVEGEASSSSSYKQLVRNSDIYEIMLGYITVSAGATAITQSMITDTRADNSLCGVVSTFSQKVLADGSVTYEKLASDAVKLTFSNILVNKNEFVADTTYDDFPFRAAVPLANVMSNMVPEVVLSLQDATSGNFAPICNSYTSGIYLYAASQPEAAVRIPTIICWRGA